MDHRGRREALMRRMGSGTVAIFPAAPERVRNGDVLHPYRQDSDLRWLTGFDEPQSVLVLRPDAEERAVLFVRPHDPAKEVWDGRRAGVEGAVREFGVDAAYELERLDELLPRMCENARGLVYRLGFERAWDERVIALLGTLRKRARLGATPPAAVLDPAPLLHEMRLFKDAGEVAAMRRAGEITAEAHAAAMRQAAPGMREYQLQATIEAIFRGRGGAGPAYGTIVAAGDNATILHHRAGAAELRPGELCVIDAGCEYDGYAADVTRTFPVDRAFGGEQRACYELVLAAQEAAIAAVRPGATLEAIHGVAVRVLAEGMVELGLLDGPAEEAIASGAYRRFYMHRTSHWLGMDVHDVGAYFVDGEPRRLEPGMVLTVEPGLYVGRGEDGGAARFRGIGVRIEDDVLVTEGGCEVLSAAAPKSVADVEAACRG